MSKVIERVVKPSLGQTEKENKTEKRIRIFRFQMNVFNSNFKLRKNAARYLTSSKEFLPLIQFDMN